MKKQIILFLFATTIISCGSNEKKTEKTPPAEIKTDVYTCPMKCNNAQTYDRPGTCSVCGMELERVTKA